MSLAMRERGNGAVAPFHPDVSAASSSLMTLEEVWQMAGYVAKSRMFGAESPEQAFTLMMIAQAEGLHPMLAVRRYHIVKGRPTMRADAMQAEFQSRGGTIRIVERSEQAARATFAHPVHQPDPVEMAFTMADARRAGLVDDKGMYHKYPATMLWARLVTMAIRTIYPGIVAGIYSEEEVNDMAAAESPRAVHATVHVEAQRAIAAADPPVPGWNPAEVDARPYHEVVAGATGAVNSEYPPTGGATTGLDARKVHGLLAARAVNTDHADGPAPTKVGAAVSFMTKVYDAHRQWVREELASLCREHVRELVEATEALAESRKAPGDESQEPDEDSALDTLYPDGQLGMSE